MSNFSLTQVVPDTTNITIDDKTIIVIDENPGGQATDTIPAIPTAKKSSKAELTHFAGIDFGFCQLIDDARSFSRDAATDWLSLSGGRSVSWRWNVYEQKFRIYKDYVGIYTGLGCAFNSLTFSRNIDLTQNEDLGATYVAVDAASKKYVKNKLRTTVLQVPLMLEFNTSDNIKKTFSFSFGAIGGWTTFVNTKQKWETNEGVFIRRKKDDFSVNPFTVDLSARIGYRKFSVFASYALTPLFSKNQGVPVYPVTFGVQLVQY
ncbi:MAG: hypothetical protein ACKO7B_16345 [Flavobacteriales bacterium]